MTSRAIAGWLLPDHERDRLRLHFPPSYAVDATIQHHVTLALGVAVEEFQLPQIYQGTIVGTAEDGQGVQALVVAIGGTTRRPDGGVYHITWSLDRAAGRHPSDSNVMLQHGWDAVSPITCALEPAFFNFQ